MFRIIAIGNPEFPFKKLDKNIFEIIYIIDKEQHCKKTFVTGNPIIVVDSFEDKNIRWIIQGICKYKHIDAIVNFDEKYQFSINSIISDLGLSHINLNSIEIANDKFKTREVISRLNLNNIPYSEITNKNDIKKFIQNYGFPIVVKSKYGTGSKNIFFINSHEELNSIPDNLDENFIVEKYIPGDEYSAEFITIYGKHYLMGITDKLTTGIPKFVEIEHIVNGCGMKQKSKVEDTIMQLLDGMRINIGITHTEFKIYDNEIYIIETHARPGGDCIMDLIENITGVNPYELFIYVLLGKEKIYNDMVLRFSNTSKSSGIRYLKHPKGKVKNIYINNDKIELENGFVRMYMPYEIGSYTNSFDSSFDRDGWIMVISDSTEGVKNILNRIESQIKIKIDEEV